MNTAQAILFKDIYEVAPDWLNQKGYDNDFLVTVLELSRTQTPFYKMLQLWSESASHEREEIMADLEEMVEEFQNRPTTPVELPYVSMDKLSSIANKVVEYKKFLKERVAKHGGVSAVTKKCKMSQPSLSRFLNSASLPRKTTLEKLAKALELTQKEMTFEWIK